MFKGSKSGGFSLVELMVVVAIIGILASLAIPQVTKFQAKARQSEAKSMLSTIYSAEKAFYAEYSAYHSAFQAIGFSPEGTLRYNVGFKVKAAANNLQDAAAANGYNTANMGVGAARTTLEYCAGGGAGVFSNGCALLAGTDGAQPLPVAITAAACTAAACGRAEPANAAANSCEVGIDGATITSNNSFTACAFATIYQVNRDAWRINQNKNLVNMNNGIP